MNLNYPPGSLGVTQPKPFPIFTEALTSRTVSGNTASIVLPDGVSRLFIGINAASVSGSGATQTFTVQQMDANGNWQTFTPTPAVALTASALTGSISIGEGQITNFTLVGPIRVVWTASGTVTTFQFQIGITGR